MIAPHIVSHVQPTGRDYSGTTSPDLITRVPTPDEARTWAAEEKMRRLDEVAVGSFNRYFRLTGRCLVTPTILTTASEA